MLLEAVDRPFRFQFADGVEVRLTPGHPVRLDDDRAQRLLAKAPGKVRMVQPAKPDWLAAWRELAVLTYGITADDPRYGSILERLNCCDDAYLSGNWSAFEQAAGEVKLIVEGPL